MMKFLKLLLRNDHGASAAEYALILAIVGTGIAVAAFALGDAIGLAVTNSSTCMTTPTPGNCA